VNDTELQTKIDSIRENMRWIDFMVHHDYKEGDFSVSKEQAETVEKIIDLLQELNWQLKLNAHKELKFAETKPINIKGCGKLVKIRSCRKEHGDKTYLGIYLGDMALSIQHSIKDDVLTASHSFYNPAIFVPELNDIVYGCESWWGEIKSPEEVNELITDDVIKNVWYVKLLREDAKKSKKTGRKKVK